MHWAVISVLICLGLIVLIIFMVKIYIKATTGWDNSCTCLTGKTIIVTGANSGNKY